MRHIRKEHNHDGIIVCLVHLGSVTTHMGLARAEEFLGENVDAVFRKALNKYYKRIEGGSGYEVSTEMAY